MGWFECRNDDNELYSLPPTSYVDSCARTVSELDSCSDLFVWNSATTSCACVRPGYQCIFQEPSVTDMYDASNVNVYQLAQLQDSISTGSPAVMTSLDNEPDCDVYLTPAECTRQSHEGKACYWNAAGACVQD